MTLTLAAHEREELVTRTRGQRTEVRVHQRARIVLLAADGVSNSAIARTVGTSRVSVIKWVERFRADRVEGLGDLPRSGRPFEITPLERHQVVAAACQSPRTLGVNRDTWTRTTLMTALVERGHVRHISESTVGRVLADAEIKPHRVKMWCHSRDPAFQTKMRAIVDLYVDPPAGEPVLCVDEKTGMQALSRSRGLQPAQPGRAGRFEFEYKRNGTRCLFACFNIRTGQVLGRVTTQRKRPDFLAFMDLVAASYRQRRVHVVLDNLNTHCDTTKGAFVSDWNRRHGGRFVFHYTPTKGSWLNQVELWFGIVSRRVLRFGNFHSPDELVAAIDRFVVEWNSAEAHPFRWTYHGHPLVSKE